MRQERESTEVLVRGSFLEGEAEGERPEAQKTSPNLPEWTFEMVDKPWSVHGSNMTPGQLPSAAAVQQQLRRSAEARSGDAFGRGLVAGLMLSVGMAAGIVGTWWAMSRDAAQTEPAVEVASFGDQPAEPASTTIVVDAPVSDATDGSADENADAEPADEAAATIDPLTGTEYPTSLRGLNLDQLAAFEYPRSVLTADGGMELQGRVGSQERADALVAEFENFGSPGSVDSNLVVTPGFPDYSIDRVFFNEVVLFGFNSVELEPEYLPVLDRAVAAFETFPGLRMTVIGFADPVGTEEVNLRFSRERAQAIVDYWIGQGVGPERISVTGGGTAEAAASNQGDDADPARYRRVEFAVDLG